jgi:hypothetical protein
MCGYCPLGGGGLSGGVSAGGVSAGGGVSVGEVLAGGVSAGGVFAGVLGVPGVVAASFAVSVLLSSRGPQALRSAAAAHSGIHAFMLIVAP